MLDNQGVLPVKLKAMDCLEDGRNMSRWLVDWRIPPRFSQACEEIAGCGREQWSTKVEIALQGSGVQIYKWNNVKYSDIVRMSSMFLRFNLTTDEFWRLACTVGIATLETVSVIIIDYWDVHNYEVSLLGKRFTKKNRSWYSWYGIMITEWLTLIWFAIVWQWFRNKPCPMHGRTWWISLTARLPTIMTTKARTVATAGAKYQEQWQ